MKISWTTLVEFGIVALILWVIFYPNSNKRSDEQINQNALCRDLNKKVMEAKTTDELTFAGNKFLASCPNWKP